MSVAEQAEVPAPTTPAPVPARIGPDCAGVAMTPEEFDAIDDWDDLFRYDLIRGILVVSPIPSEQEADPNEDLGFLLRLYRETHPEGAAMCATLCERYVLGGPNRRKADRVIWAGLGRRPKPGRDTPTIVVEFVSKGRRNWMRDYVEKRGEYLALGVVEYWVIDRFRRSMTVYRGAEPVEQAVAADGTYRTPLLPGFELAPGRLFEAAEGWESGD